MKLRLSITAALIAACITGISSMVTASILVTVHQRQLDDLELRVAHCLNGGALHIGDTDFECCKLPKWRAK